MLQATVALLRRSQARVPRIRQGSAQSAGTRYCHVRQQRPGEARKPFVAPDLSSGLVDRATVTGVASGRIWPMRPWRRSRAIWHRLQAPMRIYLGAGWFRSEANPRRGQTGGTVWIPAGVAKSGLGSVPLTFLAPSQPTGTISTGGREEEEEAPP